MQSLPFNNNLGNDFRFAFNETNAGLLTWPNVYNPTFSINSNQDYSNILDLGKDPQSIVPTPEEIPEQNFYSDLLGFSDEINLLVRRILIAFLAMILVALGIYLLAKDSAVKLIPNIPIQTD